MYHDYFEDPAASGLRNPYGPDVTLLPHERGPHRQRLLLLGVVGAGLSVVAAAAGGAAPPTTGRVAAAPDRAQTGTHPPGVPEREADSLTLDLS